MEHNDAINAVSNIIQVAVAPVFLITGIAGFLAVLSTRLARIMDRARLIESRVPFVAAGEKRDLLLVDADMQWHRIRTINWAIRLLVWSALCVCVVVMCLFIGDWAAIDLALLISALFVAAMVLVILALLFLLFEVSVSTRKMRKGLEHLLTAEGPRQVAEDKAGD